MNYFSRISSPELLISLIPSPHHFIPASPVSNEKCNQREIDSSPEAKCARCLSNETETTEDTDIIAFRTFPC
ncbi:unnamed protein product [Allacma fusca]|uniref:Uncharacterized protein n=1 Tax=Allacma fusca TaxID=39272 RepID=A0A8J2JZY2_9HEXA|nr:unnamed protein product [Allacma fusca]